MAATPVSTAIDIEPILMSWSGGKDSALSLHELRREGRYAVKALVTTVTQEYDRISMHGVRRVLLEQQAQALGLPLEIILIPPVCTNETYEARMKALLEKHAAMGIRKVAFGDIFLEDLRRYRETKLATVGMGGLFPIWKRATTELARTFIDLGFRSVLTCVDSRAPGLTDGRFVGREFDERLLEELPAGIDPCGENGEFHSFCYAGPIYKQPIRFKRGEVVLRDERFWYCDLLPEPLTAAKPDTTRE